MAPSQNSRILGINHSTPTNTIENITYGYDQNGLRTAMSRINSATALPQAVTAAYDAANELTNYNSATQNLTYDSNGNLTSDGIKTYSWNSRNQLTAISGGGVTASFVYDAVGRRISKTINGTRTDFQYDGNDIVSEIGGGSAVNATYIRTQNIDEPLARITSNGIEYYHTDALGSVFALTDAYGNTTASYSCDPFGNTTQTGISTNPFQYTGREQDGTGLYYYRARYYSPALQRFISEDPLDLFGNSNLYQFVQNSPTNFVDPSGLYWEYSQNTGVIIHVDEKTGDVDYSASGYSGNGIGLNNPAQQHVRDVGPIPEGTYTITQITPPPGSTLREPLFYLDPSDSTDISGRTGGFEIHGDNPGGDNSASKGCIIQNYKTRNKIKKFLAKGDNVLRVHKNLEYNRYIRVLQ